MTPTLPIIMLNWNGIEDTLECVGSLMEQSYPNFMIYLLDNGSNEKNRELLQAHYSENSRINLIFQDTNLGFTRGNNLILQEIVKPESGYNYVVLLNNDTVTDKDWLHQLLSCVEETGADLVTCKMINYYNRSLMDNAGHKMLNTAEIIPIGSGEPIERYNTPTENFGPCAGAALYSVEMLRKIGIFDEYFETGYEDAELGARAVVLGYKSVYHPGAIVYHKVSRSVKKIMNYEYLLKIQLNIFYTYGKLMPASVLFFNLPFLLFKYGMVLLIDIVFLRIRFLKIMSDAIYRTIIKERKTILQARRQFFRQHTTVSGFEIFRRQQFFLWFDIQRFVKYVLLRRPTIFER